MSCCVMLRKDSSPARVTTHQRARDVHLLVTETLGLTWNHPGLSCFVLACVIIIGVGEVGCCCTLMVSYTR